MENRNNSEKIVSSYYSTEIKGQVSFGTSGHRGSSLDGTFNEKHILSITQAVCDYRKKNKISGPLFLGYDTHALSFPAFQTALEVFAANNVYVFIHANCEYTPTPVISFMILEYNRTIKKSLADGVIITPSHNPPEDGGFKYNPPHGGPADIEVTNFIEKRANQLINSNNYGVKRIDYMKAYSAPSTHERDFITPYVESLSSVIDTETIHQSKIKIGIDPMGGSGINFWDPIADKYGLDINVVNSKIDKTFSFMPPDYDGKIRLVSEFGNPYYRRIDGPITNEQKTILSQTSPDSIKATSLAGLSIVNIQTKATGNNSPIGGIKVNLSDGSWFAIRPSGTEPKMKLYIESFGGEELWKKIHDEAFNLIFHI